MSTQLDLKHANLTVDDVASVCAFFEQYFEMEAKNQTETLALLVDEAGFALSVMTDEVDDSLLADVTDSPSPGYPSTFHVGFYVDTEQAVEDYREEMIEGGIEVTEIDELFGQQFFYAKVPGGGVVAEVAIPPKNR